VRPALPSARQHGDAVLGAVCHGGVEVVDVERDVVAADVAVARHGGALVGRSVGETPSKTAWSPQRKNRFCGTSPGDAR